MLRRISHYPPNDYPPFAALPVRQMSGINGGRWLAVHLSGRLALDRTPLVCLAGFHRNMSDYADFVSYYRREASPDWPIVLVDFVGRGRAGQPGKPEAYSTVNDAHDLAEIMRALGISRAVFIGEGHGGQAIMALSAIQPGLIAGAVLIDAAPCPNPAGIVRTRTNLQQIANTKGEAHTRRVMRQMLSTDYPQRDAELLDRLAARTHFFDASGQVRGIFDPALITFLDQFSLDDDFVPQWQLFDGLARKPLMLVRSQRTDNVTPDMFYEMTDRRPDAVAEVFAGTGSPPLLDDDAEAGLITDFVTGLVRTHR